MLFDLVFYPRAIILLFDLVVGGCTGMEKGVEMALVGDQGEGQYLRTKALSNVANNVIMTNTFIPE